METGSLDQQIPRATDAIFDPGQIQALSRGGQALNPAELVSIL